MTQEEQVRYAEALTYATLRHAGQKRKYTNEDYIVHPIEVSELLVQHGWGRSIEMRMAALLHDVVEDTGATYQELMEKFGPEVTNLVFWLSDASKKEDGNRDVRKQIDRWHIAAAPTAARLIKCADLISNSRTIVPLDPNFARVYIPEKARVLSCIAHGIRNESLFIEAVRIVKDSGIVSSLTNL